MQPDGVRRHDGECDPVVEEQRRKGISSHPNQDVRTERADQLLRASR
jgi:hypothetical protein